ncbi:hypothetical protein N9W34_06975, partial [Rickettsiales bacterium]|nr:hypothetical protein [Rickettsiales bacterium]
SISESQICSTEVLSEQLPKVNELLENSMNDISVHFSKVAEYSRAIDNSIQHIDDSENQIEINGQKVDISKYLKKIASDTSDPKTKKELDKLSGFISSQHKDINQELKNAHEIIENTKSELSTIVMGLQFQDRVSQNIVITINIMKAIVGYLDNELEASMPNITKEERRKLLDKDFAKILLSEFRLGELQESFVNHLLSHGYIQKAEDIGFSQDMSKNSSDNDEIDLF